MDPKELEREASDLISPVLERNQMELVDVVYRSEGGHWILRFYVDKPGGVKLDECAGISRQIEDLIEIEELISHPYRLEVSSPGLDRVLNKQSDFRRFSGKAAKIVLREAREGRRNFKGRIVGCQEGVVELVDAQGNRFQFPIAEIKKAKLEIEIT